MLQRLGFDHVAFLVQDCVHDHGLNYSAAPGGAPTDCGKRKGPVRMSPGPWESIFLVGTNWSGSELAAVGEAVEVNLKNRYAIFHDRNLPSQGAAVELEFLGVVVDGVDAGRFGVSA